MMKRGEVNLTYQLPRPSIFTVYICDLDNIENIWKIKDFFDTSGSEKGQECII